MYELMVIESTIVKLFILILGYYFRSIRLGGWVATEARNMRHWNGLGHEKVVEPYAKGYMISRGLTMYVCYVFEYPLRSDLT